MAKLNKSFPNVGPENDAEDSLHVSELLGSMELNESNAEIPIAIGRGEDERINIQDLSLLSHILIGGAVASGKSVLLNSIILSLLRRKNPDEVKLLLIDPKMIEYGQYNCLQDNYLLKIPKVQSIVTSANETKTALEFLAHEMDYRYQLLETTKSRNLKDYNLNATMKSQIPYIVVCFDEYADLVLMDGKDIEDSVIRLAQKGSEVGIHLIIATQHISSLVIPERVSANFPTRIALRTVSCIDSKIIIGRNGAEQLNGKGEMLFSSQGKAYRMQGAMVLPDDIDQICNKIVNFQQNNNLYSNNGGSNSTESSVACSLSIVKPSPIFVEAATFAVQSGKVTISSLQRGLSISYSKAGKIMEWLEETGIVERAQGGKFHRVLVDSVDIEEIIKRMND